MIILMGMIIVRTMHITTSMITMRNMTSIMHMDIITIIIMTIAM